ncbi:unnamed protein product [Caenorhabditis auriculariae]|uniref:Peptidase M13 C-terminal domain-containing protein n=1 Tax=Caenorhabditis auriculariae TaxID=2777116 RepID=A0A8S1H9A7_9PELO|nr:unnamed protein product [Caenorhabditis auriculariae]
MVVTCSLLIFYWISIIYSADLNFEKAANEDSGQREDCLPQQKNIKYHFYPDLVQSIDRNVDPCDDFYGHVCNRWISEHPIPEDSSSISPMDELTEKIGPAPSIVSYNAYTSNDYAYEYLATRQLLIKVVNLLKSDDIHGKIFHGSKDELIQRVNAFSTVDGAIAQVKGFDRTAPATRLFQALQSTLYRQITAKIKFRKLSRYASMVDWNLYISSFLSPEMAEFVKNGEIQVHDFLGMIAIDKALRMIPKKTLEMFLDWTTVLHFGTFLDSRYQDSYKIYHKETTGATKTSPEKDCVVKTSFYFTSLVDRLYVDKHFSEKTRQKLTEMVATFKSAFTEILSESDWMDDVTKEKASLKLSKMRHFVGYNDDIFNETAIRRKYEKLSFSSDESYFGMMKKMLHWTMNLQVSWLNTTREEVHLDFPATDVNAFYDHSANTIGILAGVLQTPYFNDSLPSFINYGAIGSAIGHEITHGFDNRGAEYDERGNKVLWWDEETAETFLKKSQCIAEQYVGWIFLTINENIADNGALRIAIRALHRHESRFRHLIVGLEDHTPMQLFFMSNAFVWCRGQHKETFLTDLQEDVHAPPRYRVNVAMSNQPEFAAAFSCPVGSNMNPENKCVVW